MPEGVKTLKALKALKTPSAFPPLEPPRIQNTLFPIPNFRIQDSETLFRIQNSETLFRIPEFRNLIQNPVIVYLIWLPVMASAYI